MNKSTNEELRAGDVLLALYESPMIVEVGKAEALTLGTNKGGNDNCGCQLGKSTN